MLRPALSLLRASARRLPGVIVLAGLALLAYWGHLHEWKMPSFAELLGQTAEKSKDKEAGDEEEGPNFDQPVRLASEESVRKNGLEMVVAEERSLSEFISAPGVLEYNHLRLAHLSARVQGTVWRVLKHHGDRVDKGTVLALIDAADVGRAKGELLLALAQIDLRSKIFQRLDPTVAPPRQIEEAESSLDEARLRAMSAEQALANLGLSVTSEGLMGLSGKQLLKHIRFQGLPEGLKVELEKSTDSANLLPITAPFPGVVIAHDVSVGEVVTPLHAQALFTVADLGEMWVSLSVREENARRVQRGQEIVFQPDHLQAGSTEALQCLGVAALGGEMPPRAIKGTIEWISTEVDEKTRTIKLHAHVPNPGEKLLANSFGTGRIRVRTKAHAIAVPQEAIQADGPLRFVFVKVDEVTFQPRKVMLGIREGDLVEILTGLQPGEVVVTTGCRVLTSELFKSRLGSDE